jgi:F-type H+-transporting ATPase subunit gamma
VLGELLPATVRLRMYQCFLDAAVSEQVMRIRSMKAATDNAEEMIRNLTLQYNRTRQAQITTELAEIIGGRGGVH